MSTQLAQARLKSSRSPFKKKLTYSHSFYSKNFINIKLKNQTFSIFSGDYSVFLVESFIRSFFLSKSRFWRNFAKPFLQSKMCLLSGKRVFFFNTFFSYQRRFAFPLPYPELYFLLDALLDYFTFTWELILQGPSKK